MTTQQCPECSSQDLNFFEKRNRFNCNECGASFEASSDTPEQLRIFISYGRDEYASLAERLKADLAGRGHEVWFDKERLKEGGDWEGYIDDGLNWVSRDAAIGRVVFIMTPHSVRRPDGYCLNEIAKALGRSIPIIPVMLVFCEPPLSIYRLQYLDMQECFPPDDNPGTYARQLERLTLALEAQKLDFEGAQSRLLKTLEPISFSADISKLLRDFTGRQWVFNAVDNWLHDPAGSKVFWLTGAPGVGKSAIAAWVRDNRREIGAFHFCDIHSEEKRNPSKLVRSVAYQLSTQLPAYEERLKSLQLEGIVQEYHEAYTLFDKLIVQPMADNFPQPDRTIVILIDALDEATYQKRNEISLFLSRCADKTPKWLRFLVTSRPEPEISAALQSLSPYLLDTSTDENKADIIEYLRIKLPQITDSQIAALLEKSEGVFLYVRHVCGEVKLGNLSLDRLDQFPRGLGDIYLQFFERQFGKEADYYTKEIRPLLCLILASFEPLQLGFLKQIFDFSNRMELFDRLDRLGSLFPRTGSGDKDTIAPFHRSLGDWLSDKERSGIFYLDSEYGHRLLADYGWNEYLQGTDGMSDYSLEWLPSHLVEVEDFERLVEVVQNFDYLMAKTNAGMLERLLADFRELLPQLTVSCRTALRIEEAFFRERAHILRRGNAEWSAYKILLQLAIEHADDSPLTIGAEKFLAEAKCDWAWLRGERRPEKVSIDPCVAVLEGHTNSVTGAQVLTDGNILTWSADHNLRLWDNTGKTIFTFAGHYGDTAKNDYEAGMRSADKSSPKGHIGEVLGSLELSDGRIISWSRDCTLRLWNRYGKCVECFNGHEGLINGVCVASQTKILSWSVDGTLRLWELDGKIFSVISGHNGWINGAIELSNNHILSWSKDCSLRIWENTGKPLAVLSGHGGEINGASELSDGRIISWSKDCTLKLWSQNGNLITTFSAHSANVRGVKELSNGKIISWSFDGTAVIWNIDGSITTTLDKHSGGINGLLELSNGMILTWSEDKTLRLWNLDTMFHSVLEGHKNEVLGAIELMNMDIVSWSFDKTIRLWNSEGKLLAVFEGHTGWIRGVMELPDNRLLSWSEDNNLMIWNNNLRPALQIEKHDLSVNGVLELHDKRIISWATNGTTKLWSSDGITTNVINNFNKYEYRFRKARLLSDGRIIYLYGNNKCQIINLDGTPGASLEGHDGLIWDVIELHNGNILSWSEDRTLRIWNWEGMPLNILKGHANGVKGAVELSDGRILSWPHVGPLRIWDSEGNQLELLEGEDSSGVYGTLVLSSGDILSWFQKSIRLWDKSGNSIAVHDSKDFYGNVGAQELSNGKILFWTEYGTWHLRDTDGSLLPLSYGIDEILRVHPEVREPFFGNGHAYSSSVIDDDRNLAFLRIFGRKYDSYIYWNGKSKCESRLLKQDGNVIVTQDDGQVCFLRTYYGNRRVSIEELERIVAEKEGLEWD